MATPPPYLTLRRNRDLVGRREVPIRRVLTCWSRDGALAVLETSGKISFIKKN